MRKILLLLMLILPISGLYAQITSNYTFSSATNGSLTDMSTGATNLLVPKTTTGEFVSAIAPIGFDFWLMGTRQAYFSVNSNGLMRLGKKVVNNSNTNTNTSAVTNTPSLFGFWDNLNSYITNSTSRVRYKVTGAAPNRVLTVEWKDFIIKNASSNGVQTSTWQVKLYETTGVFQFVYGRMQIGTGSSTVNASIGMVYSSANDKLVYVNNINSPNISTVYNNFTTNLVNSSTVGNINVLNSTTNGNRVTYTFTPDLPSAAPTGLSFSAVTNSGMTLTWTDAATNEFGYVIYRSDDGGNTYNFISQTAANVTSSLQTALAPSTLYYWKVYAVTEGALSSALTGNKSTLACVGAPATNILTLINTGGTINWTAAAWSLGHVPTACENVVINFNRTSNGTSNVYIVSMNVPVTINNLTINGSYGGSSDKSIRLYTNGNALTVLGNLIMSATGGNGSSDAQLLASTGAVVTIKGNSTIGLSTDSKLSTFGGAATQDPDFYIKGDMTFNKGGGTSYPGTFYFDGGATQTITNYGTTNTPSFTDAEIGKFVPTTLTLGGTQAASTYIVDGSLVVHSASTLLLPFDAAFNQANNGNGALILKANATMKLSDNFNGPVGSNFPVNYDYYSIDPASTVEYNAIAPYNQVIFTDVTYGNLVLTNNTIKSLNDNLFINGNLTNNVNSTFRSDYGTYFFGTNVVNNGSIQGLYANSEFGFYGNTAQTYSGTGDFGTLATPFASWGVDIFNPTTVTLSADIYAQRYNLFNGTFVNSNRIKIGSSTFGLVQRGGAAGYAAGSFDAYPVINSPNNYYLRYDDANAVNTGFEIPATGKTYNTYSNNSNGVTLTANLEVTNDVQLIQGTFDMVANTVKAGNTITRTGGNLNGTLGTLEMNGAAAQTIPASTFFNNNLKNLVISNTNNTSGVTLGGTLDVYRSATFGAGGRKLSTGGYLSLKSTAAETAWLGQMTASNSIVGDVTVERYVPNHSKAWQLLAAPTSGQTINQAWQEGNTPLSTALNPGYGTIITSNTAGTGFDIVAGNSPSMMTYNAGTGLFNGIAATNIPFYNSKGYMVFVRGNRTVTASATPATSTTLRSKGTLFTPANPPAVINLAGNTFESIGNPYASAIDLTTLTLAGGIQDIFYVWDPKITNASSAWGYGAYQTFTRSGATYTVTPGGPMSSYPSGTVNTIQSGQAFFVHAPFSVGSVTFTEANKTSGSSIVTRVASPAGAQDHLRTNMYVMLADNKKELVDGNMVEFNAGNSNSIDIKDALKLGNTGENLGMMRNGQVLAVERRNNIQRNDTIFYNMGKLRVQEYVFEFIPSGIAQPYLEAWLEDSYLHSSKAVSMRDTTEIRFNIINVPGSYAPDRFRLVFKQSKKRPELSPVGVDFGKATGKAIAGSSTTAAKAIAENEEASVAVYPNPVAGKKIHLQLNNQPSGSYEFKLFNSAGQPVYETRMVLSKAAIKTATLTLSKSLAAGTYQLQVSNATGLQTTTMVLIQ